MLHSTRVSVQTICYLCFKSVSKLDSHVCLAGLVAANGTSRIQCCFRACPLPASISGVGCGDSRRRLPRAVRGIGCEESAPSPDAPLACKRSVIPIIATSLRVAFARPCPLRSAALAVGIHDAVCRGRSEASAVKNLPQAPRLRSSANAALSPSLPRPYAIFQALTAAIFQALAKTT